jgi:Polycystin cation channel
LFILWIKLLDYFRIERSFSNLINLLESVAKSIVTFLQLLFLAIMAFAGSFYMLAQNNDAANNFAPTYLSAIQMAFELSVGNYDRTQFGTVGFLLVYLFFLLGSLALLIIMMNLLISIVSDTFNVMSERANIILYKEFC